MPSTLELCEEYFNTRDIYKIFDLKKSCDEKDIKKAYYKLSLKIHPDRVSEDEKETATEKFKILSTLYKILTDKNKKALYDEQGIIDDDSLDDNITSWLELWKSIFKPITVEDIDKFKQEFVGSELEKNDIKKSYLNGKGCINYMMNCVPFMSVEDEPRIQKIVAEMIKNGEVPEYKIFTNEPKAKRDRRHKKYAKEKLEAEKIVNTMKDNDLEKQIMERRRTREQCAENFFNNLIEKYGKDDDSKEYSLNKTKKNIKKAKESISKTASTSKSNGIKKKEKNIIEKGVKSGRVTKKKK